VDSGGIRARLGIASRGAVISLPSREWGRRRTARMRVGTAGATAPNAVGPTLTTRGHADETGRRSGYQSSYGSSSSTPSTAASRSGRSVTSAWASNQVFGLTRTDEEWSTTLEAALTATRRDDIQHGTNAAYIHGCVCSDCRRISRFEWAGTAPSADQPPAVGTRISRRIQQLFPAGGASQTLFHVPQSSVSKDSPFLSVTDRRAGPSCSS
jgi:hypothetical protein